MTTLTLSPTREAAEDTFNDGAFALIFADRMVRLNIDGDPVLRDPRRVNASDGAISTELPATARCNIPAFFYIVTAFDNDGSVLYQHKLQLPDTGTVSIWDLVPEPVDLDACPEPEPAS